MQARDDVHDPAADQEKGRPHPLGLEDVQQSRRPFGVRAVIEGNGDRVPRSRALMHQGQIGRELLVAGAGQVVFVQGDAAVPTVPTFVAATGILTIPTVVGVEYKVNGVTATTGAQTAAPGGSLLQVTAHALSGYYFETETPRTWAYVSTLV